MSQSQLFLRFKETIKIEKAINNTYVETNNYNEKYNDTFMYSIFLKQYDDDICSLNKHVKSKKINKMYCI